MTERVRIKRDVRPYGGRIVYVQGREQLPNGRRVVLIADTGIRGIRQYDEDETEPIQDGQAAEYRGNQEASYQPLARSFPV
jgi:hypothetical protein